MQFGDCDPAGIVFFPNFSRWMDAASLSFFMQCGVPPWRELVKTRGIVGTPLLEINTKFIKAVTYGEDDHDHDARRGVAGQGVRASAPRDARRRTDLRRPRMRAFVKRDTDDPERLRAIPMPEDIRALCE